ncbi:MAG: phosphopentomutase [Candidatus Eremiobacterota bacterium]
MQIRRALVLVLDGCGAGPAPDADLFGDVGENSGDTLVHVARAVGGLSIPTLRSLGLGNCLDLAGGRPVDNPRGSYGRLRERSLGGKDTVTGHWEMMGIVTPKPFPTYPNGFPPEVVEPFCTAIGCPVLGNRAASGTTIIAELGQEHQRTGHPILYTSADSVFQIAAHESVVPIERLYEMCRIARRLLTGDHAIQRVIARPFEGSPGSYRRTERRKDFPLSPPENVIDRLAAAGKRVAGIGVVPEVFDGRGFAWSERTQTNQEHYEATLRALQRDDLDFLFVNFEDFDMLYGHRNDATGFAAALETFDGHLAHILGQLRSDDLLIVTADHGNDPTTPSTDHSREYAPLLLYGPGIAGGRDYGDRDSYADIGATLAEVFGVAPPEGARSLL